MSGHGLQTLTELLRDRLDPGDQRRLATTLVGLRLLSLREEASIVPAWPTLVASGRPAVEEALARTGAVSVGAGSEPSLAAGA